jgi:hypothetical protein
MVMREMKKREGGREGEPPYLERVKLCRKRCRLLCKPLGAGSGITKRNLQRVQLYSSFSDDAAATSVHLVSRTACDS